MGRATTAATAAATTRRGVGVGLVAIGVGAAAGFPRGAAAKASRPDVENVREKSSCFLCVLAADRNQSRNLRKGELRD